jgi:hypothetical protein
VDGHDAGDGWLERGWEDEGGGVHQRLVASGLQRQRGLERLRNGSDPCFRRGGGARP